MPEQFDEEFLPTSQEPAAKAENPYQAIVEQAMDIASNKRNLVEYESFTKAAQGRSDEAQQARNAGMSPKAQTAAEFLSYDEVKQVKDQSPIFFDTFVQSDNFAEAYAKNIKDASYLERMWDYGTDFTRAMRVGSTHAETAFIRMKQMLDGDMTQDQRVRLDYLHELGIEDMDDISREADGTLRNQLNPLNWPLAVGEQAVNFGGAAVSSVIFGGIGAVVGGAFGSGGIPDPSDIVTAPSGAVIGGFAGRALGVVGFTGALEGGLLFDELVRSREARGEEIDMAELRTLAMGGGLVNGIFEAIGMRAITKLFPASMRKKVMGFDMKGAMREMLGAETTAKSLGLIFSKYAQAVGTEAGTEAFQEMVNSLAVQFDGAGFEEAGGIFRFLSSSETLSRIGHAAMKGAQVAAVLGGGGSSVSAYQSYNNTQQGKVRVEAIEKASSKAEASSEGLRFLQRMNTYAAKNREAILLYPEETKEYAKQLAAEVGLDEVYIDAKTVVEVLDSLDATRTSEALEEEASTSENTIADDESDGDTASDTEPAETNEVPEGKVNVLAEVEKALRLNVEGGMTIEDLTDLADAGAIVPIRLEDYISHIAPHEEVRDAVAKDIKMSREHSTYNVLESDYKEIEGLRESMVAAEEAHEAMRAEAFEAHAEILKVHQKVNEDAGSPLPDHVVEGNAMVEAEAIMADVARRGVSVVEAMEQRTGISGVKAEDVSEELHTQLFYQEFSEAYGGEAAQTRQEMSEMESPALNYDGDVIVPSGFGYAGEGEISNLSPLQSKLVRTTAFRAWFGDSKVVDENGEPMVMYHGRTNDADTVDYTQRSDKNFGVTGDLGAANYFTNSEDEAAVNYAGLNGGAGDYTVKVNQEIDRIQDEYISDTTDIEINLRYAYKIEGNEFGDLDLKDRGPLDEDVMGDVGWTGEKTILAIPASALRKIREESSPEARATTLGRIYSGDPTVLPVIELNASTGEFVGILRGSLEIDALMEIGYTNIPARLSWKTDMSVDDAIEIAESRFPEGSVLPVFLRAQNPLVLGENKYEPQIKETEIELEYTIEEDEEGDIIDETMGEDFESLLEAIRLTAYEFDESEIEELGTALWDNAGMNLTGSELEKMIRGFRGVEFTILDDATGEDQSAPGHFLRMLAQEMGHDAIIDLNAGIKWQTMQEVYESNFHVVTFDPSSQKHATDNRTFIPGDARFLFQETEMSGTPDTPASELDKAVQRVMAEPRLRSQAMLSVMQSKQDKGDADYWLKAKPKKDGSVTYSGVLSVAKTEELRWMNMEFVIEQLSEAGTKSITKSDLIKAMQGRVILLGDHNEQWITHGPLHVQDPGGDATALIKARRSVAISTPLGERIEAKDIPFDEDFSSGLLKISNREWESNNEHGGSHYSNQLIVWKNVPNGEGFAGKATNRRTHWREDNVMGFNRIERRFFPSTGEMTRIARQAAAMEAEKAHVIARIGHLTNHANAGSGEKSPTAWIETVQQINAELGDKDTAIRSLIDDLRSRSTEKKQSTGNEMAALIEKSSIPARTLDKTGLAANLRETYGDEAIPVEAVESLASEYRTADVVFNDQFVIKQLQAMARQGIRDIDSDDVAQLVRSGLFAIPEGTMTKNVYDNEYQSIMERVEKPVGIRNDGTVPPIATTMFSDVDPFVMDRFEFKVILAERAEVLLSDPEKNLNPSGITFTMMNDAASMGRYVFRSRQQGLRVHKQRLLDALGYLAENENLSKDEVGWKLFLRDLRTPGLVLSPDVIGSAFGNEESPEAIKPSQLLEMLEEKIEAIAIEFPDNGPSGNTETRVTHIVESQTDWHQQARKIGYKNALDPSAEKELADLRRKLDKAQFDRDEVEQGMKAKVDALNEKIHNDIVEANEKITPLEIGGMTIYDAIIYQHDIIFDDMVQASDGVTNLPRTMKSWMEYLKPWEADDIGGAFLRDLDLEMFKEEELIAPEKMADMIQKYEMSLPEELRRTAIVNRGPDGQFILLKNEPYLVDDEDDFSLSAVEEFVEEDDNWAEGYDEDETIRDQVEEQQREYYSQEIDQWHYLREDVWTEEDDRYAEVEMGATWEDVDLAEDVSSAASYALHQASNMHKIFDDGGDEITYDELESLTDDIESSEELVQWSISDGNFHLEAAIESDIPSDASYTDGNGNYLTNDEWVQAHADLVEEHKADNEDSRNDELVNDLLEGDESSAYIRRLAGYTGDAYIVAAVEGGGEPYFHAVSGDGEFVNSGEDLNEMVLELKDEVMNYLADNPDEMRGFVHDNDLGSTNLADDLPVENPNGKLNKLLFRTWSAGHWKIHDAPTNSEVPEWRSAVVMNVESSARTIATTREMFDLIARDSADTFSEEEWNNLADATDNRHSTLYGKDPDRNGGSAYIGTRAYASTQGSPGILPVGRVYLKDEYAKLQQLGKEYDKIQKEISRKTSSRHSDDKISDAPFKGDAAPEMLFRMALIKAINQGDGGLSWDTGDTVIKRWGSWSQHKKGAMQKVEWESLNDGRQWKVKFRGEVSGTETTGDIEQLVDTAGLYTLLPEGAEKIIEDYAYGRANGEANSRVSVMGLARQYDKTMNDEASRLLAPHGGGKAELRVDRSGKTAWFIDIPAGLVEEVRSNGMNLFQADETNSTPGDGGPTNAQRKVNGWYNPELGNISLTENANASTYLHESAHAYMHILVKRAQDGDSDAMRDVNLILSWFGVDNINEVMFAEEDTDAERAAKRKLHEQFADGFLLYVAEGKAPTGPLQVIFDKFKTWLTEFTKQIMERGDFELSDEVRDVYGRMVSADSEIATAQDAMKAHPMSQFALGLDDNEYRKYTNQIHNAVQSARRTLDKKVAQEANRKKASAYRKRKAEIKKSILEELSQQPVYMLRSLLMSPKSETRLDNEEVRREMEGQPNAAFILKRTATARRKEDGQSAALIADDYGYASIYDMLKDMANAPSKASEAERRANEAMVLELEVNPDIAQLSDGSTDEAEEAMHNSSWENAIISEIVALEKLTGRKSRFPVKALKVNAQRLISNLKLKSLKPNSYITAGSTASNRAYRALERGDKDTALEEKGRQLLNQYLYREALAQQKKADKNLAKMQRLNTKAGRKGIDESFLPHIVGILSRFDLRRNAEMPSEPASTAAETKGFVISDEDSLTAKGEAVRIGEDNIIYEEQPVPWHQLTVTEFEIFSQGMKNLVALGRSVKTVTLDGVTYSLSDKTEPIIQNLQENVPERDSRIPKRGIRASLTSYWVELRKRRNEARKIDGYEATGGAQDGLITPMSKAQGSEENRLEVEYEALRAIFDKHNLGAKKMSKKRTFAGGSLTLTNEQILSVALNYGNESNRQRITETIGFYLLPGKHRVEEDSASMTVREIVNTVTPAEWVMVQEVWDYLDTFWSEVAALEQRTTGIVPARVEPIPFTSPTGVKMRGGYYPLSYDSRASFQSNADETKMMAMQSMSGFGASAMTAHGHTTERVGSGGRIVKMELSVMFNHVGQVVHDLTHRETLNGIHRILRDSDVAAEMQGRLGQEDYAQWIRWVQRTAVGDERANTEMEKWAGKLRGRVTIMGMGLNFSTAALQLMGLTQSQAHIGGKWVGAAMGEYLVHRTDPKVWRGEINDRSSTMKQRGDTFNRDVRELGKQFSSKGSLSFWESAMFSPIVAMQSIVDSITWTASYNKAIFEGEDEQGAVDRADSDVVLTQGSGRISDLSGVEGGNPFTKLFTTFYSFMNTMFNLSVDQLTEIANSDRATAVKLMNAAQSVFLLYILPATMTSYVLEILIAGEEPEDEKAWLKWAGQNQMNYFVGQFPVLREFVPSGYRYSGPAGIRFFENIQKGTLAVTDLLPGGDPFLKEGEDDWLDILDSPNARAIVDAAGVVFPLPTTEIKRFIRGAHRIEEDETEGIIDAATGLVFRKAR